MSLSSLLQPTGSSTLNNPALVSAVKTPVATATLNGMPLPGLISAEVTNVSHSASDTFRAKFALSGNSLLGSIESAIGLSQALPVQFGANYFSTSVNDQLGLAFGFNGGPTISGLLGGISPPQSMMLGQIDEVTYDPVEGTLELSGRDLSAQLIDSKTAEKFVNQTSSQIAQTLAARHGLNASVTNTTTLSGTYYEIDHVVLTQEQSEWDLLVYLARKEGFDLYVLPGTSQLYFGNFPATGQPYQIQWSGGGNSAVSNALHLRMSRSQTMARDVIIKIKSWNQANEKGFTKTYKVSQALQSQRANPAKPQVYSYSVPNLSIDQALQYAKTKAEEITRHEKVIDITLPGDNLLTVQTMIQLVGTGTGWDQMYFPDTIHRRFSFEEGYVMEVQAKNHSTQNTTVLS